MPHEELRDRRVPARTGAAWLAVPLLAASAGALGWTHVHRLRSTGAGTDPELAIAVLAAGACLVAAGWWIGGLLMLSVATVARRCRWTGLEQWAGRLTPALVARTAAALVGAQLITAAPAHADDAAPDPFWGPPATGTEQLADGTGGSAGTPGTGTGTGAGTDGTGASTPGPAAPSSAAPGAGDPATGPLVSGIPESSGAAAAPRDGAPPSARADSPAGTTIPGPESASAAAAPPSGIRENLPARERVIEGTVTVLSGDTLWDLTAGLLGPGATDDAVCRHLPSWLEHNTLAQDGDLIRPGDQLRVPPQLLDAAGSTP
ncbi:hypothetical protein [Kocuria tytonis]|uniref:LysM domain-containing protein n=1 Tax=Kocuria tytonis TaxID=2054280 RepID=A0A495AA44_9MICC|nr:hypothetical protein [Kocuria tytonis]RKQ36712.1 hypothetical protein C1C97_003520 [Kocuria tytonis]